VGRNSAPVSPRKYSSSAQPTAVAKRARCREHSCPNASNAAKPYCARHTEVWSRHHDKKIRMGRR
jgi:hypothetical protein